MSDTTTFLSLLGQGPYFFQAINDKVKGEPTLSIRDSRPSDQLAAANLGEHGIFVQINPNDGQGTGNENIIKFVAAFADLDKGLPEGGFALEPTAIVQSSSGKYQYYWFFNQPISATVEARKQYRALLKGIIAKTGSDPACADERRILRLPGFLHNKREPQMVTLSITNGHTYTLDQLLAAFPPVYEAPPRKGPDPEQWPEMPKRIERAKNYLATTEPVADGEGHNGHLFWAASLLLRDFALPSAIAYKVYKEYDKGSRTPASEDDLQRIFDNAGKHASGELGSMYGTPEAAVGDLVKLTSDNMVWGQRINSFWRAHKITVTWTGIIMDGAEKSFNDANNKFIEENLDRKPGNILMAPMSAEHERFLAARNKEVVDSVRFDPAASPIALRTFVAAITNQHIPEVTAVVGHFIWSVKRKLQGLPVTDHIMPVLVGNQRAGKSTAINKLLAPLGHHLYNASFDIFQDDRNKFLFHTYATIFLDEMAKARKADLDGLKNIITSNTVSYRKLYTADATVRPNISTFIGCSNTPVSELIYDTTGMRRFFEVQTLAKLDWDAINTLDFIIVWKSINEHMPSPLNARHPEVAALSERLKATDFMDDWMDHLKIHPGSLDEHRHKLYQSFKLFMKDQGLLGYVPSYQRFYRRMEHRGFIKKGNFYGCTRNLTEVAYGGLYETDVLVKPAN